MSHDDVILLKEVRKEIRERRNKGTLVLPKSSNYPINRSKLTKWTSAHILRLMLD